MSSVRSSQQCHIVDFEKIISQNNRLDNPNMIILVVINKLFQGDFPPPLFAIVSGGCGFGGGFDEWWD